MQIRRQRNVRRQAYQSGSSFSVGPTTIRYIILLILAVFSLMYLIQSAQGADKIVELRGLEKQKTQLNKDFSTLQVNASRLQSLQNLQDSANKEGLTPLPNTVPTIDSNPTN